MNGSLTGVSRRGDGFEDGPFCQAIEEVLRGNGFVVAEEGQQLLQLLGKGLYFLPAALDGAGKVAEGYN